MTESQFNDFINEQTTKEELKDIIKNDPSLEKKIKDAITDAIKNDKNFEKRVKNITADSIRTMYRILFQRYNFYDGELRN